MLPCGFRQEDLSKFHLKNLFSALCDLDMQRIRSHLNNYQRHRNLSNNTGTTHYDSLKGSYWADQKDSHNEVIMTSLQGQLSGPKKGIGIL